jgi:prepilin-type N-terminal cleavage/methylation domain-containing protein
VNANDRQSGFSLIELLVVITIFSIVIIAASQSFVPLLSQSKQQSKIAATNIEGMLGLEVLRRDIAHAGYGLYWSYDVKSAPTATPTYTEVTAADDPNGVWLNDAPNGIPRAIVVGAGRGLNGSDRIAVKSLNVAWNEQSERWTYLYSSPNYTVATWSPATENIGPEEYVIVMRPDTTTRFAHFTNEATPAFSSKFKDVLTKYAQPDTTGIIFSLGTTNPPKMAFNRGDYYIANTGMPTRCAQGTGVLYKAVVDQTVGSPGFLNPLPLLDCVADMQVGYRFDDPDINATEGYADNTADATIDQPLDAPSARQIREVRVYILAQEGQMDRGFTYSNNIVRVGEAGIYGRDFDLSATITNWQNYRWKLYTLIIEPMCLVDWTVNP